MKVSIEEWLGVGNCANFYFAFEFEDQMWVWIYQIFKRVLIPLCHLSNKSNQNTDKPKFFELDWFYCKNTIQIFAQNLPKLVMKTIKLFL